MHLESTDHVWTLRLGRWSRNLFRREVGSCRRKAGAWRDGNWNAVLPRARLVTRGPGRCLEATWSPSWRVLLASCRWRPGVVQAPHGRSQGAQGCPQLQSWAHPARCRHPHPRVHGAWAPMQNVMLKPIEHRAQGCQWVKFNPVGKVNEMSFAFVNGNIL